MVPGVSSSLVRVIAPPRRVALFVTCLVDLFRPSVGFAAVKLLEDAGCTVEVPPLQVCCGQPAYNSGDRATTRAIAAQVIEAFEGYEAVVAPSGSCGGMLSHHYPGLFDDDPAMKARAEDLAARSHELMSFLVDVLGVTEVAARYDGAVTYHDSCSGLRELGVKQQPRRLLGSVQGLTPARDEDARSLLRLRRHLLRQVSGDIECHGGREVGRYRASGADTLLAGDLGCLMNMAGKLQREGSAGEGAARRRGAGRHGRPAADRRSRKRSADAVDRARLQAQCRRRARRPQSAGFARPS